MVGTSGSAFERSPPNKARGRALPALICDRQADTDETRTCELLPSNAVNAGPPPWVGRCRSLTSAAAVNKRGGNVERAIETRGAEDDFVGALLGVIDELLQALVRLLIVADQHAGIGDITRERDEIRVGELRLPAEQPVDLGKAGDRGQMGQQRIAVGLGVGGDLSTHLPGGARLGVDHDRLLHHRLQNGRERTHDDIDGAARRKRVDHGDGARGIGVLREGWPEGGCRSGGTDDEAASIHAFLLWKSRTSGPASLSRMVASVPVAGNRGRCALSSRHAIALSLRR